MAGCLSCFVFAVLRLAIEGGTAKYANDFENDLHFPVESCRHKIGKALEAGPFAVGDLLCRA